VAGAVEIAYFPEASSVVAGPYDLSLVEGSITTAHDAERIHGARQSKFLVTIGACATAGGIQALRNFADVKDFVAAVYASPEYIKTLATSTPISAHVKVDFELRLPDRQAQLLEVISPSWPAASRRSPHTASASSASCAARLRHGAGHALPGPGHPCRLRRDLPGLQPRLLRLLRPDGDARTPPALAREWQRWATPRDAAPRLPHLQRGRRAVRKESDAHGD
jgi:sulfhydrogenase subunit delta